MGLLGTPVRVAAVDLDGDRVVAGDRCPWRRESRCPDGATLRIRVVDPMGRPVKGAGVAISAHPWAWSGRPGEPTVHTVVDGDETLTLTAPAK